MKLLLKQGTTSKRLQVFIQANNVTTGAGLTGLTNASAGLTAYYFRDGDTATTAITLAAGTIGTWSSGGFVEIDSTHMGGVYELGLPNAALANLGSVIVYLQGATNMAPCVLEIEVIAPDPGNANWGMSDVSSNVVQINGAAVSTTTAQLGVNVVQYNGQTAQTDALNLPKVDVEDIKGAAVSTTAAQLGVNVVNWDGQAAQVDANNLPKVDAADWGGVAVGGMPTSGNVTVGGYAAGEDPATLVLDVAASSHNTAGTIGAKINSAASAGDPWATALPGAYAAGTAGAIVGGNLDAKVSSRAAASSLPANFGALVISSGGLVSSNLQQWLGSAPNALVGGKVDSVNSIRTGTAQAGASGSITLDSGASATDQYYRGAAVQILSGTGAGQVRLIDAYTGSTKVASVLPTWTVIPDATSVFAVHGWAAVDVETWAKGPVNFSVTGYPDVNARYIAGTAATLDANGLLEVDVQDWAGAAVNALVSGDVQVQVAAYATGLDPASEVLGATASSWNTAGMIGAKINAAGGAADPLANAVPGSYAAGTAGYVLGTNLNATVSSRMATFTLPTNFSALAITVGGAVTIGTNGDKTGYSLASSGVDSIVIETGLNLRQATAIIASAVSGVLSGAGSTTVTIDGAGVSTTRITATVDSSGDRSVVTLSPPA